MKATAAEEEAHLLIWRDPERKNTSSLLAIRHTGGPPRQWAGGQSKQCYNADITLVAMCASLLALSVFL